MFRFHPPLVYGRKGDADVGEGICCCVGTEKGTSNKVYMIICYELPIVSARAIPQQIDFFNKHSKNHLPSFIVGELSKF